MLNAMAPPVRSRSGRPEFGRVYLRSLIASAEERVDLHRTRGHRLRQRVATRRLRKLLAYENQRHVRIGAAEQGQPRVVLGLVSTKVGELEPEEELVRGIEAAARVVPLEDLCLSPQCGFSSTVHGNDIAAASQVAKLRLVVDTARAVWSDAP